MFTFNGITAALAPGNAIHGATNHLREVATNSTWSDIGAATGALIAGSFLNSAHLNINFFIATVVLLVACIYHIKVTNFHTRGLLKWK